MTPPNIPDRSAEPAVQESLDRSPKARTASNSNDIPADAPPEEARDDEGNFMGGEPKNDDASAPTRGSGGDAEDELDDEEVEERTGVPPSSKELSDM